jgi:hypothetical protein
VSITRHGVTGTNRRSDPASPTARVDDLNPVVVSGGRELDNRRRRRDHHLVEPLTLRERLDLLGGEIGENAIRILLHDALLDGTDRLLFELANDLLPGLFSLRFPRLLSRCRESGPGHGESRGGNHDAQGDR